MPRLQFATVGQCRLACAVRYRFSRADATDLANFIQPMLHFVPESRATARVRMLMPIARALDYLSDSQSTLASKYDEYDPPVPSSTIELCDRASCDTVHCRHRTKRPRGLNAGGNM